MEASQSETKDCEMAGTSVGLQSEENISEIEENDEQTKSVITNAIRYTQSLLQGLNLLTDAPPSEISAESMAMGAVFSNEILEMLADRHIIHVDEFIGVDEVDELQRYVTVSFVCVRGIILVCCTTWRKSNNDLLSSVKPYQEMMRIFKPAAADYVSLSYKQRAVAITAAHLKWSLKTLQAHGLSRLKNKRSLYRWRP